MSVPRNPVIYARISLDKTGRQAGANRQIGECRDLAARLGWPDPAVLVDNDLSASTGVERPDYDRLLAGLQASTWDGVLTWHPDRLHRRLVELEGLIDVIEARGAPVATVTAGDLDLSTASGRMTARILTSVARHESERMAERLRSRYADDAAAGKPHTGQPPYGYRWDSGALIIDERVADEIRAAVARLLGGERLRQVLADWRQRVPTASALRLADMTGEQIAEANARRAAKRQRPLKAGQWSHGALVRALTSPALAGRRTSDGGNVPGTWPPIISVTDHERLKARFRTGRPAFPRAHPLTGITVCGRPGCGKPLRYRNRSDDGRGEYLCPIPADGGCGRLAIMAAPAEREIRDRVAATLAGPGLERFLSAVADRAGAQAVEQLEPLRQRLVQLEADWMAGELDESRAAYEEARARLRRRISKASAAVGDQEDVRLLSSLPRTAEGLAAWWDAADVSRQHALLRAVANRILIRPAVRRGPRFDPERITVDWRDRKPTTDSEDS